MCDPRLLYPEKYGLTTEYLLGLPHVGSIGELTNDDPEGEYIIGTSGAGLHYHRHSSGHANYIEFQE